MTTAVASSLFFFLRIRPPPRSTLFPYPPLSRSPAGEGLHPATLDQQGHLQLGVAHRGGVTLRPRVPVDGDVISQRPPAREGEVRPHAITPRSEEHTSELQSQSNLVCRLLLEKKK